MIRNERLLPFGHITACLTAASTVTFYVHCTETIQTASVAGILRYVAVDTYLSQALHGLIGRTIQWLALQHCY